MGKYLTAERGSEAGAMALGEIGVWRSGKGWYPPKSHPLTKRLEPAEMRVLRARYAPVSVISPDEVTPDMLFLSFAYVEGAGNIVTHGPSTLTESAPSSNIPPSGARRQTLEPLQKKRPNLPTGK